MRRRKFIALIGGAAAAWPVIALGQQGERVRRIGLLTNLSASDSEGHARDEAFITELRQLGWAEGTNLQIDRRSTDGDAGLALQFAQELVALAPDVALRGHMGELGIVSAKGRNGTGELLRIIANGADSRVSPAVRGILEVLARQHSAIGAEIASIDRGIMALHRACEASRRLAEIPGIGPIGATALVAEIGDWNTFSSGRSLAAWIGLVPKQHSTGGKDRLGSITKQGNRYLRWLLVVGAMAVIRYARKHGTEKRPWLGRLMERRPTKVAAVALANKIARMAWAIMVRGERYKEPKLSLAA